MNKMFIAIFAVCLFLSGIATAQDESSQSSGLERTVAPDYTRDARAARLAALRSTYKISLTEQEKSLIQRTCSDAQDKLSGVLVSQRKVTLQRTDVYQTAIEQLQILQSRLSTAGSDNSSLDLLVVFYQQKLAAFEKTSIAYETALQDASEVNCVELPDDFRAALEGVRFERKEVVASSAAMSEITRSSLKTTLDSVKSRLPETVPIIESSN
jgi:hypothetical protein